MIKYWHSQRLMEPMWCHLLTSLMYIHLFWRIVCNWWVTAPLHGRKKTAWHVIPNNINNIGCLWKCVLVRRMVMFHDCLLVYSLSMGTIIKSVWFSRTRGSVICILFMRLSEPLNFSNLCHVAFSLRRFAFPKRLNATLSNLIMRACSLIDWQILNIIWIH